MFIYYTLYMFTC